MQTSLDLIKQQHTHKEGGAPRGRVLKEDDPYIDDGHKQNPHHNQLQTNKTTANTRFVLIISTSSSPTKYTQTNNRVKHT